MAGMTYKGARTNSSVASDHVEIEERHDDHYHDGTTSATIDGTLNGGSSNVYVNGRQASCNGDPVTETESYSIPSGWRWKSSDGGGMGYVTSGSSNVFVNGRQAATAGSSVTTHAGTTTSIAEGSSNVHIN